MSAIGSNLLLGLILVVIILISLSVHEFAHAFVSNLFGDPTARLEGRMTFNPLAHWDRIGTTLLVVTILLQRLGFPLPAFGWGKPVPVNERNFDNPRWQGFQTAIAGPMSNLVLAVILAGLARFAHLPAAAMSVLALAVYINLFLMFFNLVPIPPLDGSRILRLLMSDEAYFSLSANPIWFFGLLFVVIFFLLDYLAQASQLLANFLLTG